MTRFAFFIIPISLASISFQLTFIREFFSVNPSNELVLGIFFGNWLVILSFGARIAKFIKVAIYPLLILLIGSILPFLIFLIRLTRHFLIEPGGVFGPFEIFLFSFLFLFLPGVVIGGSFVFLSSISGKSPSFVYSMDCLGCILGGFTFSFLAPHLGSYHILSISSSVLILVAIFILVSLYGKKLLSTLVFLSIVIIPYIFHLEKIGYSIQYKGQDILFSKFSKYGHIVVTKLGSQINLFENGMLSITSQDIISAEETIHFALVQHPDPKRILLLGNGLSGSIKEALKYGPRVTDYVELDPLLISVGKRFFPECGMLDKRVNYHLQDARLFIRKTKNKYDAVIISLPSPSNAYLNRFYTKEFFSEIKDILNEGGIISLSITGSANYFDERVVLLNSSIYHTLRSCFSNVIVIPGEENIFIASFFPLSYDIGDLIEKKGVETLCVNKFYFLGRLTDERINYLLSLISEPYKINRDLLPVGYWLWASFWLSIFSANIAIIFGVMILITLFAIIFFKKPTLSVFTFGFLGFILEVCLLILFQINYGYLYHWIGFLIASFMGGLAFGSYTGYKKPFSLKIILSIFILYIIFLFGIVEYGIMNKSLFVFSLFILGVICGLGFSSCVGVYKGDIPKKASFIYSSELLGSFIGAISVPTLLPYLGFLYLFLALSGFCLFVLFLTLFRQ
ncbi:TPA: hypothetical protein DCX16_00600 [bacterium]|nr:hypothetical protein [bacterium]